MSNTFSKTKIIGAKRFYLPRKHLFDSLQICLFKDKTKLHGRAHRMNLLKNRT